MKRHLLLALVLAGPLYLRQREVERRQRQHRQAVEAEVDRLARECFETCEGIGNEVGQHLNRIVKEVNQAFERAGRP